MLKKIHMLFLFLLATVLFFAVVIYTVKEVDIGSLVNSVSFEDLTINVVLGSLYFASTGLIMRAAFKRHYKLTLSIGQIFTLPLMMNLFTYLLPVKGGLLFQIFYLKQRYGLELNKGFSLGVTVFLIGLSLTVLLGLMLVFYLSLEPGPLLYLLLVLTLSLAAFPVALKMAPSQKSDGASLRNRLIGFLVDARTQLEEQLGSLWLILDLGFTSLISALVQALWYEQTARMLGFEAQFLPMLLIVLLLRVILLLRLLPGNLGFQEIVIGATFAAAGFSVEQGLLVALSTRLVSIVLVSTIGMGGLYGSLKYFSGRSVGTTLFELSQNKEDR